MKILLSDYIDTLQSSIKDLDVVRDVYVFGGKPTDDDLKQIKLQPNSTSVLLTASGGDLIKSHDPKAIDSNMVFAAYIIGPAQRQRKSLGYAPDLIDAAQALMGCVKDLKSKSAVPHMVQLNPEFLEWGEMASPIQNSSSHACWYIVWNQRITLQV